VKTGVAGTFYLQSHGAVAAKSLGISRKGLYLKRQRLKI